MKRFAPAFLALLLAIALLPAAPAVPAAAIPPAEKLSGEVSRETREILLADGTKTGVRHTRVVLDGTYGSNKEANIAEFSLANTHLSVEVINCGERIVNRTPMDRAAADYNASHEGQTVLAAVNGDLFMTKVHSVKDVVTKGHVLATTRGAMIVDGEIWSSQQMDQENLDATNAEKGGSAGSWDAFGVTDTNQPLVGSPVVGVTIAIGGREIRADGVNRLPARNALVVYNHRVNSSNYAMNDAYEVELEAADTALRPGGSFTAQVKAIYPVDSTERPAIGARTILLTARGNRIPSIMNRFVPGDTVTLKTALTDRFGHTELWQRVRDAIGGHMEPILDGRMSVVSGASTEYPASFVGYRDDGSVALVTISSTLGKYAGLKMSQAYQFCSELGYNSAFYLDGGGSATFVSLEDGVCTVRNQCSDGQPRSVINGIGVVWNDTPVCERQGSLDYIKVPVNMSAIPASYLDGALLSELVSSPNSVSLRYDEGERALVMTTERRTNDPNAALNFTDLKPMDAEDAAYFVFKVKTNHRSRTSFALYYAAGNDTGPAQARTVTFLVEPSDDWQYLVVNMSRAARWSGRVNSLRLDIFDSAFTDAGVSMYIGAIVACRTAEEAAQVEGGWAPEGAVTDYLAYLESLKPVVTEPPTEAPTEPPTDAPTEPPTDAPTGSPTEAPTDAPTEGPTEAPTASPTETPTAEPDEGGCQSALGALLPLTCALALLAALPYGRRRREGARRDG